jgi:uncharacterized protein YraI
LVYSFTGDPNQNLLLDLSGLEGLNVEAELSTSTGEVLAKLSNRFLSTQLLLPSGGDSYLLKLNNPLLAPVNYRLLLSLQAPSQALAELPTTGPCVLATFQATAVNVRAAPSTEAQIINTLLPSEIYSVIGRNTDSSWYQISYIGGTGWVAASVTRRGGDCRNVAITATLTPPTATATTVTGPTATATTGTGPTATSGGPTATPSPTATTASQQAPIAEADNDQSLEINIKSDSKTLTGAISFPQGDTQDAVFYRVLGFDSVTTSGNVNITAVCTGPGAENARVSFGGGAGVPCNGASSTQFHTNDSNQGRVSVSLQAGDGALVNWTLVFNASN